MLKQDIEQRMKEALKKGDVLLLSTLRFLLADIKNYEIDLRREAADEDVLVVVKKQIKQHRESVEAYQKAGRKDLQDKEQYELDVLSKYLPPQMTSEELKKIVVETINLMPDADKNNFGKVMGMVMGKMKGTADGNIIAKIVKETLSS